MKKPYDRVTEAYYAELGDAFAEKTRKRIHWICGQAQGKDILDVGCSQGITSILLGREGKQVKGIDLLNEAITYAQDQLKQEEPMTQENVKFIQSNFINEDFKEEKFDSIIFGEVLEHISDPIPFLEKAAQLLHDDGRIVITLPFGINDYFDHKKTYYLLDILQFQKIGMNISSIKFFGKWIGAIFEKTVPVEKTIQLNEELIRLLEEQFEVVEREHLNTLQNRKLSIEKLKKQVENFKKEKTLFNQKIKKHQEEIKALQGKNAEYETKTAIHKQEIEFYEKQQSGYEEKIEAIRVENESARKENHALASTLQDVKMENESYQKKHVVLEEKLEASIAEKERIHQLNEKLAVRLKGLDEELTYEKERHQSSIKQYEEKVSTAQQYAEKLSKNSENEGLVKELNRQLILAEKEKIQLKEQLVAALQKEQHGLQSFSRHQKQYQEEIRSLKASHTVALRENIDVKEQLHEAYRKEERVLNAYKKLLRKYTALSESKLGKFTLARWEKLTQKRNKAKRR